MAARFYEIATAQPWQPTDIVTDKNGVRRSADNVFANWSNNQIETAFPVKAPTWAEPPAGQVVDTETVTINGGGALVFTRTFKPLPNPTFAQVMTLVTAAWKRDRRAEALELVRDEALEGRFTTAEVIERVRALSPAQKDQLAAVFGLVGADLPQ